MYYTQTHRNLFTDELETLVLYEPVEEEYIVFYADSEHEYCDFVTTDDIQSVINDLECDGYEDIHYERR